MMRALTALFALAFLGTAATADCLVLKRGGKTIVWGMPEKIQAGGNEIEITPDNIALYADQSTGVIEAHGYDAISVKKTAAAKVESFPLSEVVSVYYSSEPDDLAAGLQQMEAGQFLAAIGDFKNVLADPEARETFKSQALYRIGICYLLGGRIPDCVKHFQAWKPVNSKYTPEAYQVLASLLTEQRDYAGARARYDEISKLPGIPDAWKYKARLGGVKVGIAERKYDEAERTAQTIARETQNRADLVDATALALGLQAESIWRGGNAGRLADAAAILEKAAALDGVAPDTRAFILVTQGNILYAQGKPEEARFPYLRAALMYPGSGYDALAYLNAGQCFLDMSGRLAAGKEPEKSDQCLVDGMKLLAIAAGPPYRQPDARKRHAENKQRYDEIMAKGATSSEGGTPPEK
jgi:tetratricopeptide (TPR) repeat protein